ncbi:phosphate ABC transporter substrate-binding protein [Deltaproteobacteria bacterium IMCC39524]|nr:phosphate ABC transporter substrate-binding protein [Deltaproteobacteria bacterium IMCC39524]
MKRISLLIALMILFCCTAGYAADVILITNKLNPVSSLTATDAKNMFLGKKTGWSDGSTVTPFTQKDSAVTDPFAKKFVKKSSQQFYMFWRKAVFTGKGTPPVEVENSEQMKKIVAAKNGAVGYILKSELDDSVKKLSVE